MITTKEMRETMNKLTESQERTFTHNGKQWYGPYTFNNPDGGFPLFVETPASIGAIQDISAMAENDELEYWGGITQGFEDFDNADPAEYIFVSNDQIKAATSQIKELLADEDEDDFPELDEDDFLGIWQDTLGLF